MPMEMTDIIVSLKEKKYWTSAKSYDELAEKMSKALQEIPGMTAGFQYPVQMRFNELIAGARQDVVCKIFGENLDSLASQAHQLAALVRTVDGAKDIFVESVTGLPQIVIRYKRDVMAMYGLSINDVNRIVRASFAGDVTGKIYEDERRFDLVVRMGEHSRSDLTDVQQLLIPAPNGKQLPLYQVAEVKVEEGPNQIQREDAKRRIIVGFNTRGRDVQSIVQELQQKVDQQLKLPTGYYIHYGGQFENLVEAKQRLMIAVPLALLLILLMLYFAFGSIKYGLLIFSAIPLSAIGGILLLWIRDMPFSISAGVGFIALFGVAVLNGIVLITEFNRLKHDSNMDIKHIILQGTETRLRPVLMTAAVASLGFLPMALSQGAGAEVQRPLATVVIGGLVTATFLTLVLLPVLYMWFEKRQSRKVRPTAVIILALLGSFTAEAQPLQGNRVSLDSLLQMAGRQNLSLQANRKYSQYWESLSQKTFELPRTQLGLEYGNINSANQDTRFFVNQGFQMPVVYRRQKDFYMANVEANAALLAMKEKELAKEIRKSYYLLQGLMERDSLLGFLDSVYSRFASGAELRLKTGETGILEKTTAEALVQQLKLQRKQLYADFLVQQQRMGMLLNSTERWLPLNLNNTETGLQLTDTAVLSSHPMVQYWNGQNRLILAQAEVDRSRLSPEFSLGYSNLSIIGWQTEDGVNQKYYGSGNRFNIYQFGMGLPLFNSATRSRIKASQINADVNRIEKENAYRQVSGQLNMWQEEYIKNMETVKYYKETGLLHADQIIKNAAKSFQAGDLSYMEWTLLMNQAVQIKLSYLDALQSLRNTNAELIYLTGK